MEGALIYARQLDKPVKVFTKWDYEKYMYGVAEIISVIRPQMIKISIL